MIIGHVAIARTETRGECARCGEFINPPTYDRDEFEYAPVCFTCKKRPCEGWSAYCHACRCQGGATGAPGMCGCGATWTGGRTCHCATCHLTFTTVGNFDAHRVGRRCLTADDFRLRGYEPNDRGHWRKPAPEGTTWH